MRDYSAYLATITFLLFLIVVKLYNVQPIAEVDHLFAYVAGSMVAAWHYFSTGPGQLVPGYIILSVVVLGALFQWKEKRHLRKDGRRKCSKSGCGKVISLEDTACPYCGKAYKVKARMV